MAEFIDGAPVRSEEFLGLPAAAPRRVPSEGTVAEQSETYSAVLSRPVEVIRADFESGLGPSVEQDARTLLRANGEQQRGLDFDAIIAEQETERAFQMMEEFQQRDYFSAQTSAAPDIALMLSANPEFAGYDARVTSRQVAANRLMRDRMAQAGTTRVGRDPELNGLEIAGYFVDMMLSDGVHSSLGLLTGSDFFEGGAQLNELAAEASALLTADIPEEEFIERFDAILDRVSDAGLFSEDNPLYLSAFITNVEQAGVGSEASSNRAFQLMDLGLSAIGTTETAITLGRRVGQTPRNIARLTDNETGASVVVRQGDELADTDMVSEGTSPSVIAPARPDAESFAGPELTAMRDLEAQNTILDIIKQANWGTLVEPSVLAEAMPRLLARTRDRLRSVPRSTMDVAIEQGNTGNLYGVGYFGRTDGVAFKTQVSAQRVADSIGGEVVQQGEKQYVVRKALDIPTNDLADTLDLKQVNTSWNSSIVSTTSRQPASLDAMLKRGESQVVNSLRTIQRLYRRTRRSVPRQELNNINEVLLRMRDDPLHNWRREALSDAEFAREYNRMHGELPSEKVIKHYKSIRDLNDTQYFIDADLMLKQAVNNRETMVRLNGEYFRARPVELTDDMTVFNMDTNKLQKGSDLDPERAVVYEVKNADFEVPGMGRVQYVTGSSLTTRRLYHSDVLAYNSGGPRTYRDRHKFFIKQDETEVNLAGGETLKGQPTTFMGVRTQEEATKAADQWNTIAKAIRDDLPEAEVNATILRNNEWNPSIEDLDDLKVFASEHGLNIRKDVSFAGDGEPIVGKPFAGEETVGGQFQGGISRSRTRGTTPLIGYGGNPLESFSPSVAIERSFAAAVGRRGDQRYLHNAVNSWVKAADQLGLIPQNLRGRDPKTIMNSVELSSVTNEGKALAKQRDLINYRMSATGRNKADQETMLQRMADSVYGAGYTRAAKPLDVLARTDIAGFLRAMAFHTKLGLFNPDQLMVQGSQLINVMGTGIANIGPVQMARTMAGLPALRLALVDNLSPEGLRRIGELQAPITGISADDFVTLRNWVKSTGRSVVSRTAVEDNNTYAGLVGSRALDYGQVFFNEGETIARLGAALVNFAERRRRYPNEDIFSEAVTDAMLHRQDVLTASMTAASAAPWQRSLAAVPLQFVTYQVRILEQLFMSQSLKPKERWALGLTHLTAYGAAAVPAAGWVVDRLGYEGTIDPNAEYYDLLRYGALDAVLSTLTESETALSSRLAVGEGSFDFVRGLVEDGLLETMAGPGGIITLGVGRDFVNLAGNMFGGTEFNYVEYDWNRFARNISAYERGYALWMAARHGQAISRRTDEVMFEDLSVSDSVMVALGIPLQERELAWASIGNMMLDDAMLEKTVKEAERLDNIARRLLDEGDTEGAAAVAEDIGAILFVLTVAEREEVLNRLRFTSTLPEGIIRQLTQRGRLEVADKLRESTE